MTQVATGQGRDDVAVPQLRRVHVDRAEQSESHAGQAGAVEENVLRRIGLFMSHDT